MKKISCVLCIVTLGMLLLGGCGQAGSEETTQAAQKESQTAKTEQSLDTQKEEADKETSPASDEASKKHHVEIKIKDYGTIYAELDETYAPLTVANFLKLANDGFYDNLTFHRIISGFMIQGGDPEGNGMGGSDETIKGEFSNNGVENPLSHTRGAISMARSQDMDSASSQFFIVHEDSTFLDKDYAVFGYVTEGMDIVDKICEDVKAKDDNGTVAEEDQPVIESIKVAD